LVLAACNQNEGPAKGADENTQDAVEFEYDDDGFVKRSKMTVAECEAVPARAVPDDGGGNTGRAEYRCANGQIPLATLTDMGPEGGVCCAP
jgi:hypothetical protein